MYENLKLTNLKPLEIQKYLDIKYPSFYIDELTEVILGKSTKGYKNFTYNEWFFPAHFEDDPNVPAYVQVEALRQCLLMAFLPLPEYKNKKINIISCNAQFKIKILPGHKLEIETILETTQNSVIEGKAVGYINGEVACQIKLKLSIID